MAQTLSFSPLALDLPSTRMSVDFTTFASSYSGALATVDQKAQPTLPTSHLIPRRPLPRHLPLSAVREEIEPGNMPNFSHKSRRWQMAQQQIPVTARSEYPLTILSRTNSSASTASSGSAASTAASSAFSNTQSPSTARTSFSSVQYTKPMNRIYLRCLCHCWNKSSLMHFACHLPSQLDLKTLGTGTCSTVTTALDWTISTSS